MKLASLDVASFRNIRAARIEPGPSFTVVAGPNGQGKTNLLESIYLLSTLRPLRASRLAELVRFGDGMARVEGELDLRSGRRVARVEVEDGVRRAFLDGKPVRDVESYLAGLSVVAFTPDDLGIVKGGPEARRRFLDRAVFNRWPAFLAETRTYVRALKGRNRLLREGGRPDVVEAFDAPLAAAGARVVTRRRELTFELQPRLHEALAALSEGALAGVLRYEPGWLEGAGPEAEVRERLLAELARRLPRDRERGFTGVGPHADAVSLALGGRPARTYASQGQQRALALALKIAEIENLRAVLGFTPLLLLDDVSSELDRRRSTQLLGYLAGLPGQILLTTTEPSFVAPAVGDSAVWFEVQEGSFRRAPKAPADPS